MNTEAIQTSEAEAPAETLLTNEPAAQAAAEVPQPETVEIPETEIDPGNVRQAEIRDDTAKWKDSLADEIKDGIGKFHSVEDLARGYLNVQKLVGTDKISIPSKHATDEDWEQVWTKLGRPASPEEYKLELPEGTPEDMVSGFKNVAHTAGVLPQQAQKLVQWFNEYGSVVAHQQQQQTAEAREEEIKGLRKEWGTAFENKIAKAQHAIRTYADDEELKYLQESQLGNDPKLVRLFAKVGEAMFSEDELKGEGGGANFRTPVDAKREIATIVNDKMHPYNDKRHPNHKLAIREMQTLYEQAYPPQS